MQSKLYGHSSVEKNFRMMVEKKYNVYVYVISKLTSSFIFAASG